MQEQGLEAAKLRHDIAWMNMQLYGVLAEICVGKAKNKVVAYESQEDINGAFIYREFAREHLNASKTGTVALGTRITRPAQATMDTFEDRLLLWETEKEQYQRITGNKIGELALIHLQDMMPEEVKKRFEHERHNLLLVEDLMK